jgi:hypothetical protein
MSDDTPTREIEAAYIGDHYNHGEAWLVIEAAGDKWPVKWDADYGDGLIVDLLAYYELEYTPGYATVDVSELVGQDLPVTENKYGDWEGVDRAEIEAGTDQREVSTE